jgi:hypothetical protein
MAKKMTARLHCVACHLPRNGVIAVIATLSAEMLCVGRLTAHSLTTFVRGVTLNYGSLKATKSYTQPKKSLRLKAAEHSVQRMLFACANVASLPILVMLIVLSVSLADVANSAANANR